EIESRSCLCAGRHAPIFIGGQRRSGTTLMRTMLNRHPHVALVPRESFFFQDKRFETFFDDLLAWHGRRFAQLSLGPTGMEGTAGALPGGALRTVSASPRGRDAARPGLFGRAVVPRRARPFGGRTTATRGRRQPPQGGLHLVHRPLEDGA